MIKISKLNSQVEIPTNHAGKSTIVTTNATKLYLRSILKSWQYRNSFSDVKAHCLFIGYPRSGHSIVGSLIDAHPNAVIAHELDVLQFLEYDLGFSRQQLYGLIVDNSQYWDKQRRVWSGYDYHVPNQWQGRAKKILVIGDKKGGISTRRLKDDPLLLSKLQKLTGVEIKIIHVVRNPFDNIATIAIKEGRLLRDAADYYFSSVEVNHTLQSQYSTQILCVEHEQLINQPTETLVQICNFLNLNPSTQYLRDCSSIIKKSPHYSRLEINWPKKIIDQVQVRANNYDFLKNYTFSI
ncbi:MAG TPA: sulfotransferase [Gammaproteobacteria bacterium]|nr:sulfotransferase [Gammaproteobacteria bacterium]